MGDNTHFLLSLSLIKIKHLFYHFISVCQSHLV